MFKIATTRCGQPPHTTLPSRHVPTSLRHTPAQRRAAMAQATNAAAPASATVTAAPPSLLSSYLPIAVLTDSYKTTHYLQYPASTKMVAVRPLSLLLPLCAQVRCQVQRASNVAHTPQLHSASLYSTVSSDRGMTRTPLTQERCFTAFGTCLKTTSPGAGQPRCGSGTTSRQGLQACRAPCLAPGLLACCGLLGSRGAASGLGPPLGCFSEPRAEMGRQPYLHGQLSSDPWYLEITLDCILTPSCAI